MVSATVPSVSSRAHPTRPGATDLLGSLPKHLHTRQTLMRACVSKLDQPAWNTELGCDHGDRAGELAGLERVDERVDEAHKRERQRQPDRVRIRR